MLRFLFLLGLASAFQCQPHSRFHATRKLGRSTTLLPLRASQIEEINDLIESLSLEESDESRRERLSATIAEKYSDVEYCDLFNQQLILMGDQVKQRAAERAQEEQANTVVEPSNGEDDDDDEPNEPKPRVKSPEELQLWALVDMMVQSKTLVKRAREAQQ